MFRTKIALLIGFGFAITLLLVSALLWGSRHASTSLDRSLLAHQEIEAYQALLLKVHNVIEDTSRSLSGYGPELPSPLLLEQHRRDLDTLIDKLRSLTRRELEEFSDHDEVVELQSLEVIANRLERFFADLEQVSRIEDQAQRSAATRLLRDTHTRAVDSLTALLEQGISRSQDEVVATDQETVMVFKLLGGAGVVVALVGLVVAGLGGVSLAKCVRRPLLALVKGARKLADGNLSHRLKVIGNDEFSSVANHFNHMAEQLENHVHTVNEHSSMLEKSIDKRTRELAAANQDLTQASELRRRFLADISHELRTPITIIRGEAEITLRHADPHETAQTEALERISEEAKHLGHLVDDLLLIARNEAGHGRIIKKEVDLPSLLTGVQRGFQPLSDKRHINLQIGNIRAKSVFGDEQRLKQVLFILVDNALRYSEEGDTITINTSNGHDVVRISVEDTGTGISEEEVAGVFERFYRSENAREIFPTGSGLGLPMAKSIIEGHNGTIAINSRPGEGTAVTIKLPVANRPGTQLSSDAA